MIRNSVISFQTLANPVGPVGLSLICFSCLFVCLCYNHQRSLKVFAAPEYVFMAFFLMYVFE